MARPSRPLTRCTQTTLSGRPCRGWAVAGSDPPRCAAHAAWPAHSGEPAGSACARPEGDPGAADRRGRCGFYSKQLRPEELADLVAYAGDVTLDDEIALVRLSLRRIFGAIDPDHPEAARLVCDCARTISRLLRDKKALAGETADGIAGALEQMLSAAGELLGVDLTTPIG